MNQQADEYRRLARACLRLASTTEEDGRATLIEMARIWFRLASERDLQLRSKTVGHTAAAE